MKKFDGYRIKHEKLVSPNFWPKTLKQVCLTGDDGLSNLNRNGDHH